MSASGYVKGQITKATNALKERIAETERTMADIYNFEQQNGNFGDRRMATKFITQLLEAQVGLNHWMNNLQAVWKRGEDYSNKLEKEEDRYRVLQEFTDQWETSSAEKYIINTQLFVQSTEYLKRTIEDNSSNERIPEKVHTRLTPEIEAHLQRLELPHFHGNMVEFPEFWELYKSAIHDNPTLEAPAKFLHLKSVLRGTAKDLMASMTLSGENYPKAIELLLNTYNRPDVLRNRLVEQLETLPPSGKAVTEQRITLCKVKAIWVQLANLGEQPGSTMTMRTVRSKFPKRTREKVGEKRKKGDNWTTEDLIEAFDEVIDQLEIMEDTNPTPAIKSELHTVNYSRSPTRFKKSGSGKSQRDSSIDSHRDSLPKRIGSSKDKSFNSRKTRCSFCLQTRHKTAECDEVTSPYARREAVVHLRFCWKCLKHGHKSQNCDAPTCYRCGRSHHKALCLQDESSFSPRRNSPKTRHSRRDSSTESNSAEESARNSSRSRSRSTSLDSRGRSPTRKPRFNRRGSPHPKVEFGDSWKTNSCSCTSPTPSLNRNVTTKFDVDSGSDESEEVISRVNAITMNYSDAVNFNSSCQLPSGLVESETMFGSVLSGCESSTSSRTHITSESNPQRKERETTCETDRLEQSLFGLEYLETEDEAIKESTKRSPPL